MFVLFFGRTTTRHDARTRMTTTTTTRTTKTKTVELIAVPEFSKRIAWKNVDEGREEEVGGKVARGGNRRIICGLNPL